MKVLFLTDSLSDLDGVGRYSMRLIRALEVERADLEVHVLLARKHRPTSDQVPDHWKVQVALPPDYFYYMTPARYWFWRIWGTLRTLWAGRDADLIHAIKDFPHSQLATDAGRILRKPVVATAHGTYTIQPLIAERHRDRARKTALAVDRIIAVSAYTRRLLCQHMEGTGFDENKVSVVHNCVAADRYVDSPAIGPRPWHGGPFSLAIGEIKERKGHHLWLEAWIRMSTEFPDWKHFVVGRLSGDEYQTRLEGLVRAAGLQDRVFFLGNVSEAEKIDLLQRAEIFVHTPVTAADGGFEGFGIVYLEASAAGTACLGTNDSGAEDAVLDGRTGLLVDQSVPAITDALRRLMGDDALRAQMGAAGREFARSMSWQKNAQKVLGLYSELWEE
ncbi:MAG: glycosyltransferase family 4 protein [Planctomycetota bacterium]